MGTCRFYELELLSCLQAETYAKSHYCYGTYRIYSGGLSFKLWVLKLSDLTSSKAWTEHRIFSASYQFKNKNKCVNIYGQEPINRNRHTSTHRPTNGQSIYLHAGLSTYLHTINTT